MTKQELGKKIETLRKGLGVSTYSLQQKGVHPSVTGYVEKAKANYTIDTLIDYLDKIGLELDVKKNDKCLKLNQKY